MLIVWSKEDNCYLVHFPDFPEQTYRTHEDTYAEAAKNGEDVLQLLLEEDTSPVLHELADEFKSKWGGCHIGTNVGTYQSAKHLHWYIHSGKRIRDRDGNLISSGHEG